MAEQLLIWYGRGLQWTFISVELASRLAGIACLWIAVAWVVRQAVTHTLSAAALLEAVQEARRQSRPLKWFHRWRWWTRWGD